MIQIQMFTYRHSTIRARRCLNVQRLQLQHLRFALRTIIDWLFVQLSNSNSNYSNSNVVRHSTKSRARYLHVQPIAIGKSIGKNSFAMCEKSNTAQTAQQKRAWNSFSCSSSTWTAICRHRLSNVIKVWKKQRGSKWSNCTGVPNVTDTSTVQTTNAASVLVVALRDTMPRQAKLTR